MSLNPDPSIEGSSVDTTCPRRNVGSPKRVGWTISTRIFLWKVVITLSVDFDGSTLANTFVEEDRLDMGTTEYVTVGLNKPPGNVFDGGFIV